MENNDNEAHFIVISQDITDRKLLEADLMAKVAESRSQMQFQQLMLNGLKDVDMLILVIVNGEGNYNNDIHNGHMLGYEKGELPDNSDITSWIHPDDRAFFIKNYRDRIAGKDVPSTYEVGALFKNGQRREFELLATLIPVTALVQTLVLARDITERKIAEQQLKKKQENLEEAQRIGRIGS